MNNKEKKGEIRSWQWNMKLRNVIFNNLSDLITYLNSCWIKNNNRVLKHSCSNSSSSAILIFLDFFIKVFYSTIYKDNHCQWTTTRKYINQQIRLSLLIFFFQYIDGGMNMLMTLLIFLTFTYLHSLIHLFILSSLFFYFPFTPGALHENFLLQTLLQFWNHEYWIEIY